MEAYWVKPAIPMKIPNRLVILKAVSAVACLSVVAVCVFAQQAGTRNGDLTLTFTNAPLTAGYANDAKKFEKEILQAHHARYCLKHTDNNYHPNQMHDPNTPCNLPVTNPQGETSEIILVDDQSPASSSTATMSIRGPTVTQQITTSSAADMTEVLKAFQ